MAASFPFSSFFGVDPSLFKYDAFISSRGEDTSHLYEALCQNQINAYLDEVRLEKGDDVSREFLNAIEESPISIIIFSPNYASSTRCLDELVHILKCMKEQAQIVLPIFHGVDPSDIRKLRGSYAAAFVEHEQRFNHTMDKVQEWRQALKEASELSGLNTRGKSESVIFFCAEVVKDVKEKLQHIWPKSLKSEKNPLFSSPSFSGVYPSSIGTLYNLEKLLYCENLCRLLDPIGNLKHLRWLDPIGNLKLLRLLDPIGNLKHLRYLDLSSTSINYIPDSIGTLYNLETLLVPNCKNLSRLLDFKGNLKHRRYLESSCTSINDIPDSITLYDLEKVILSDCENLTRLPNSRGILNHLWYLDLSSTSINDIPDSIGTLFTLEKVILSNCENLTRLPDSIGNLKHLRYLDLSSTSTRNIPETICTLYNLETLLLSNCENLSCLPSEIRHLINLRHLDFAGSPIKELPPQISNLKDLQTLTRFIVCKEHSSIEELGDLQQLHGEFEICGLENVVDVEKVFVAKLREKKFLTSLGLYWDGESCDGTLKEREIILDLLQPHENLKALHIYGFAGKMFPDWMGDQSFGDIVEVQLSECINCCTLPPLGQLPSLKNLQISGFKSVVTIGWEFCSDGSSTTKPFRSLEVLRFEDMAKWQEFLFTEDQVFPSLKELVFFKCPKLDVWLPDCFPSLTKLLVSHCRQLMPLLGFQSLEELEIFACPKQVIFLQEGWPSRLKKIKISRCESLKLLHCIQSKREKELLHCKDFQHLTSLESLEIIECKELHRLPEELPTYPFELSIVECPFLESGGWENEEDWPN